MLLRRNINAISILLTNSALRKGCENLPDCITSTSAVLPPSRVPRRLVPAFFLPFRPDFCNLHITKIGKFRAICVLLTKFNIGGGEVGCILFIFAGEFIIYN